jgi:tetratricopeptide (TPR) repeat protein
MLVSFRTTSVNPGSQVQWLLLLGLVVLPAACAQNYPEPVPGGTLDPVLEAAQDGSELESLLAKAAAPDADLNALLVELERASDRFAEEPRYWKAFAGLSLAFAREQEARGQVDALDVMFRDAEYAYGKALTLSPADLEARQGVVYSLRMLGDFEAAWEYCREALEEGLSDGNSAWHEELGRTGLALVIEAVQAGDAVPPAALPAENALGKAIELGSSSAAIALADLLAWQSRGPEGREVLIEALMRNPQDTDAVARLQNLTPSDAQVVAWERIRRAHPDAPAVLWRLGEALWNQSWLHRQNRNWAGAHDSLDRAEALFLEAQAGEPSFASSCSDWLHLVRTAHGWVYWGDSRVDDAADAFLSALEADPSHLEDEPIAESLRLGIYSVEGHYFSQNRVDKVRSFHSRLFRSYRDNPDWTNNYAFACREVGTALASQGELAQAKMVWKESWQAYTRTVELAPNDVRLVNDRALIAVYHLDDEKILALAEQELHRATQMGAVQQAQLAEDVPEQERRDLDEAVGDAWENMAYLDVMRRQRLDRAESFLVEAVKHFPFDKRQGVVGLRAEMQRLRNKNPESDQ